MELFKFFKFKITQFSTLKIVTYAPTESEPAACLNTNHNSFILVYSKDKDESEIELRTALEAQIKKKLSIPMVLIVLEGGNGTLSM